MGKYLRVWTYHNYVNVGHRFSFFLLGGGGEKIPLSEKMCELCVCTLGLAWNCSFSYFRKNLFRFCYKWGKNTNGSFREDQNITNLFSRNKNTPNSSAQRGLNQAPGISVYLPRTHTHTHSMQYKRALKHISYLYNKAWGLSKLQGEGGGRGRGLTFWRLILGTENLGQKKIQKTLVWVLLFFVWSSGQKSLLTLDMLPRTNEKFLL